MERKAKSKQSRAKLLFYAMEETNFDYVPYISCPIPYLDNRMSTIYCTTKCTEICSHFSEFRFITNECSNFECETDSPCADCYKRIEEFKELQKIFRAVYFERDQDASINRRCRKKWKESVTRMKQMGRGDEGRKGEDD